jgi:hypothetical protein
MAVMVLLTEAGGFCLAVDQARQVLRASLVNLPVLLALLLIDGVFPSWAGPP